MNKTQTPRHKIFSSIQGKSYKSSKLFKQTWYPLEDTFQKRKKKNESAILTNLLYTLHITLILHTLGIKEITDETNKDTTFNSL